MRVRRSALLNRGSDVVATVIRRWINSFESSGVFQWVTGRRQIRMRGEVRVDAFGPKRVVSIDVLKLYSRQLTKNPLLEVGNHRVACRDASRRRSARPQEPCVLHRPQTEHPRELRGRNCLNCQTAPRIVVLISCARPEIHGYISEDCSETESAAGELTGYVSSKCCAKTELNGRQHARKKYRRRCDAAQ